MANRGVAFPTDIDTRSAMLALDMAGKTVLPEAVAETLNIVADASTKQQIKNVKRRLRVRTKYTINSIKSGRARPYQALNKARGRNIDRMFSRTGTFSSYLWTQEGGQTIKGRDGALPIPTSKARTSQDILKAVAKRYRIGGSDSLKDGAYGDTGKFFIGTPKGGGRPRGLYERKNKNKRLTMLRNLEHEEVKLKDTNFHDDAIKRYGTPQYIRAKFNQVAVRRLRRRGLSA